MFRLAERNQPPCGSSRCHSLRAGNAAGRRGRVCIAATAGYLCVCLSACHLVAPSGMAERCAELMKSAYPGADIDITKSEAAAASLTAIVAHVEGERTNQPAHASVSRHVAVECKFDNNILTGFRWTAGPS